MRVACILKSFFCRNVSRNFKAGWFLEDASLTNLLLTVNCPITVFLLDIFMGFSCSLVEDYC